MSKNTEATGKIKFRDELKPYAKGVLKLDFDSDMNDMQRSKMFLKFYIEKIHNVITSDEINDDEFELGFVDRKDDLGIDWIRREDGTVTIIQAKFRGSGKVEDDLHIIEFKNLINKISSQRFHAHDDLAEILSEINYATDTFKLIFISLGKFSETAQREMNLTPVFHERLQSKDIEDRFEIKYLDEVELNLELRNAKSLSNTNRDSINKFNPVKLSNGKRSNIIELELGGRRQVVFTVTGNQLKDVYDKERDALFSFNIRNFIGNTSFNKGIRESATNTPDEFFFFNNGVSCLSEAISIDHEKGEIQCKALQVINGAQTVRTLAKTAARSPDAISKVSVLVRVTEIRDPYKGPEKKFIEEITQFNNSQNAIKISDFRSNDLIQIYLEEQFDNLKMRKGKRVKYARKRTDKVPNGVTVVKFEAFVKLIHAFDIDPISFSSSTAYLYNTDKGGGYARIFGDGERVFEAFEFEHFKYLVAVWWLGSGFLERISRETKELSEKISQLGDADELRGQYELERRALQAKWFFIYTAKLVLQKIDPDYRTNLGSLYEKDWEFGKGKFGTAYEDLYNVVRDIVSTLYTDDAQESGFVHRNWLRSEKTRQRLESRVQTSRTLLKGLQPFVFEGE